MSYEAWGDGDGDGLDGYRDQLRDNGWLDEDQAAEVVAANKILLKARKEIQTFAETQDSEPADLLWRMVANTADQALILAAGKG